MSVSFSNLVPSACILGNDAKMGSRVRGERWGGTEKRGDEKHGATPNAHHIYCFSRWTLKTNVYKTKNMLVGKLNAPDRDPLPKQKHSSVLEGHANKRTEES